MVRARSRSREAPETAAPAAAPAAPVAAPGGPKGPAVRKAKAKASRNHTPWRAEDVTKKSKKHEVSCDFKL